LTQSGQPAARGCNEGHNGAEVPYQRRKLGDSEILLRKRS